MQNITTNNHLNSLIKPLNIYTMQLHYNYEVTRIEDTRSNKDRRFKVLRVIVSYIGEDSQEYRKSFESKGMPIIPTFGTHEELNKLKVQY